MRWALLLLPLAACARPSFPPCGGMADGPVAWVIDQGWHTEIGIPVGQAIGPLAAFREAFPDATVLMFGFGKRSFMVAHPPTLGEYLSGPIPGPGAVQVTGLRGLPAQVVALALPPGGAERLAAFLWRSIAPSGVGGPRPVATGPFPGGLLYAASRGYDLGYTCNAWTVDGLRTAGLPVDTDVTFAVSTMRQVARVAGACRAG